MADPPHHHEHHSGSHEHDAAHSAHGGSSLNRTAFQATVHCLTGCAIGEVLGMIIGTALGWSNLGTIVLAVTLAFVFGYALTLIPLVRANLSWRTALGLASARASLARSVLVGPGCASGSHAHRP